MIHNALTKGFNLVNLAHKLTLANVLFFDGLTFATLLATDSH